MGGNEYKKYKDCMYCIQRGGDHVLELRNVKKSFSDGRMRIDAVKGVDLCFPERGLFFLVGKSGSGKSTLLNLLGGLEKPTSGEVATSVEQKNG